MGSEQNEQIQPTANNGQKKTVFIIAVVAVVVVALAVAFFMNMRARQLAAQQAYEKEQERLTLIYQDRQLAQELRGLLVSSEYHFDEIASVTTLAASYDDDIFMSKTDYLNYARKLCTSELSAAKSQKAKADKAYEEFKALNCTEPEVADLNSAVDQLYESLQERYDVLIENKVSVTSLISENTSTKEDYDQAAKDFDSALSALDVADPDVLPEEAE